MCPWSEHVSCQPLAYASSTWSIHAPGPTLRAFQVHSSYVHVIHNSEVLTHVAVCVLPMILLTACYSTAPSVEQQKYCTTVVSTWLSVSVPIGKSRKRSDNWQLVIYLFCLYFYVFTFIYIHILYIYQGKLHSAKRTTAKHRTTVSRNSKCRENFLGLCPAEKPESHPSIGRLSWQVFTN